MTEEIVEKVHHLYGGSTAKIWSNCYGWASLVSKLPKEEPGEWAIKGTALHTGVLERYFKSEINYLLTGERYPLNFSDIPSWPGEEGLELAKAFWKDFFKEVLEEILTGKKVYIEQKLMLFEKLDAGGTADIVVIYRNDKAQTVLVIGDLKTGYVRVEPDSEQILFYLAAGYLRAKDRGLEIDIFKGFIYQPSHDEPYTEHKFSKSKVLSAVKKYEKAIKASKADKPKFKVGDWCTYCQAKAYCKAYAKSIEDKLPAITNPSLLPAVESLSIEQKVKLFLATKEIESFLDAVGSSLLDTMKRGEEVPGLKLVNGVSKRKWKDEEVTATVLINAGVGNPYKKSVVGLTEAEKLLKAAGKQKEDIAAIMYTLTEKPPGSLQITTTDDKREAVKLISAESQLSGLDDLKGEVI